MVEGAGTNRWRSKKVERWKNPGLDRLRGMGENEQKVCLDEYYRSIIEYNWGPVER